MKRPTVKAKKLPMPRNPVASTLYDPASGLTQRAIPNKQEPVMGRKRKHKGKSQDETR